jgi:hypothetical protein
MSDLLEFRAKIAVTEAKLKAAEEAPIRDRDRNEIRILRTLHIEQHRAENNLLAAENAGAPSLNFFPSLHLPFNFFIFLLFAMLPLPDRAVGSCEMTLLLFLFCSFLIAFIFFIWDASYSNT